MNSLLVCKLIAQGARKNLRFLFYAAENYNSWKSICVRVARNVSKPLLVYRVQRTLDGQEKLTRVLSSEQLSVEKPLA